MKLKKLKTKLWFNIFIRIAAIFAAFVLVLSLSNVSYLVGFFSAKEKKSLKEQLSQVETLDFNDTTAVITALLKYIIRRGASFIPHTAVK